jgi:hypothetical protein
MKLALGAAVLFAMFGTAIADSGPSMSKLRIADASSDACFANCSSENQSCRRVCPTTLSTPCLSSCDSQMQTCRQSCQGR